MDRLTRKELKSDRFALEVQHSVEYFTEHRRQLTRWGGVAAAVIVIVAAIFFYRGHEHNVRQAALHDAMEVQNSTVGPANSGPSGSVFPTPQDREKAVTKAWTELAAKYPGTEEGQIAEYFLGTNAADAGRIPEAEKHFKVVVDAGGDYASLAKLSLATVYASEGKLADGEKLIQSVIDHPTMLVSKESATIELAELIRDKDPARARKLLEPLRQSPRPGVSRAAITALSDMSQK